jgi:hypothetical protein
MPQAEKLESPGENQRGGNPISRSCVLLFMLICIFFQIIFSAIHTPIVPLNVKWRTIK